MSRHEVKITVPLRPGGVGRSYPAWLEWPRIVPYRFRRIHRWWANKAGFFWIPCPLCGKPFGGHERGGVVADPMRGPNALLCVCSRCLDRPGVSR